MDMEEKILKKLCERFVFSPIWGHWYSQDNCGRANRVSFERGVCLCEVDGPRGWEKYKEIVVTEPYFLGILEEMSRF